MIDYSVFSQSAAARGSIISGLVSRSATAFNFRIWRQILPTRQLVIGNQGRSPFSRKFVPGYEASTWFLLIRKQANRDVREGRTSRRCEKRALTSVRFRHHRPARIVRVACNGKGRGMGTRCSGGHPGSHKAERSERGVLWDTSWRGIRGGVPPIGVPQMSRRCPTFRFRSYHYDLVRGAVGSSVGFDPYFPCGE